MKFHFSFAKVLGQFMLPAVLLTALFSAFTANANDVTSQVIVGNASPTVTNVLLNGGSSITLTSNATTSYTISYTVSDNNGCDDLGGVRFSTSTAFRNGANSTCATPSPTQSNLTCYVYVTHVTSTCSGTSINVTDTVQIYYFADATDSSSTFPSDHWEVFAFAADLTGATSSATSSAVEVLTLTAINITTSSINYGTLSASSTTGATNQNATTTNAGNSSTTLQLSTSATLTSGSNSIATSSQRYSTSTFTFIGTSTALTASAVTVSGFFLLTPTSTTNVARVTFWGLEVPAGTATGTYTGTNVFTSLFQP